MAFSIRSCSSSQYFSSIPIPIPIPARYAAAAAISVVLLLIKGSSTVSPPKWQVENGEKKLRLAAEGHRVGRAELEELYRPYMIMGP